jgi:hypothetical protein
MRLAGGAGNVGAGDDPASVFGMTSTERVTSNIASPTTITPIITTVATTPTLTRIQRRECL